MAIHIGRREFVVTLGGAAAMWPLGGRAQQPTMPVVGFLGPTTPAVGGPWAAAFAQRLRELGWVESRTIVVEYRWAEGRSERFVEIAAEFVKLKVDVIVTQSTPAAVAAKQATSVVPIVLASAGDPVGAKLVASLARPGGNVTGLSSQQTDTASKRLELLRQMVPGLRRLAIMANVGNPFAVLEITQIQVVAPRLDLEAAAVEVRRADDIAPAFEALKGRADALYVSTDPLIFTNRVRINTLAVAARLPTMYGNREFVEAGGLMSYGSNFPIQFRRAADYVDKILRGATPANLPVEQPTKFDLVINLTTAKVLGLDVPPQLLARTDEVIE
jgi:putative tryptophan/tyrosine transport system substrate-binding protein